MEQIACPDCQLPLNSDLVFGHLVRQHHRLPREDEDFTQGDHGDDCIVVEDTAMVAIVAEFIGRDRESDSDNRKREKESRENLSLRLKEARKRKWQNSPSVTVTVKKSGHRIFTRAPPLPPPPPPPPPPGQ